nr:hypothetical protein Iba_chr02cCG15660 [Ipomoea batatas]GME01459.1 hypothetical protein Iba_scaffold545304CG0010 [Ipomoea batatas]
MGLIHQLAAVGLTHQHFPRILLNMPRGIILQEAIGYVVVATRKLALATIWDAWGLSSIQNAFVVMRVVTLSQNMSFLCQGISHTISRASKN